MRATIGTKTYRVYTWTPNPGVDTNRDPEQHWIAHDGHIYPFHREHHAPLKCVMYMHKDIQRYMHNTVAETRRLIAMGTMKHAMTLTLPVYEEADSE